MIIRWVDVLGSRSTTSSPGFVGCQAFFGNSLHYDCIESFYRISQKSSNFDNACKYEELARDLNQSEKRNILIHSPRHICFCTQRIPSQFENEIGFLQEVLLKNVLLRAYYSGFDWSGWGALIKRQIIIATGMVWPVVLTLVTLHGRAP